MNREKIEDTLQEAEREIASKQREISVKQAEVDDLKKWVALTRSIFNSTAKYDAPAPIAVDSSQGSVPSPAPQADSTIVYGLSLPTEGHGAIAIAVLTLISVISNPRYADVSANLEHYGVKTNAPDYARATYNSIAELKRQGKIAAENGRFHLTTKGVEYLTSRVTPQHVLNNGVLSLIQPRGGTI